MLQAILANTVNLDWPGLCSKTFFFSKKKMRRKKEKFGSQIYFTKTEFNCYILNYSLIIWFIW